MEEGQDTSQARQGTSRDKVNQVKEGLTSRWRAPPPICVDWVCTLLFSMELVKKIKLVHSLHVALVTRELNGTKS